MSGEAAGRVPVTVLLTTRNEERNLARTLPTVAPWADQIFVLKHKSDADALMFAFHEGVSAGTFSHSPPLFCLGAGQAGKACRAHRRY